MVRIILHRTHKN